MTTRTRALDVEGDFEPPSKKLHLLDQAPLEKPTSSSSIPSYCEEPVRSTRNPVRQFFRVHPDRAFHSEAVRGLEDTLYVPVKAERLVNICAYDQITTGRSKFHVGDANGHWVACFDTGDIINFWRYDMSTRRLFVAYSLAFNDQTEYLRAMSVIEAL